MRRQRLVNALWNSFFEQSVYAKQAIASGIAYDGSLRPRPVSKATLRRERRIHLRKLAKAHAAYMRLTKAELATLLAEREINNEEES